MIVETLKDHNHGVHNVVDVFCVGLECVYGGFYPHICLEVGVVGEHGEFFVDRFY